MIESDSDSDLSDAGAYPVNVSNRKSARAFRKIAREVSEEDLKSPAAQRLLLTEIDALEDQVASLEGYRERFHKVDKQSAVLEQKLSKQKSVDILAGLSLSVGSVCIGFATFLWQHQPAGWIAVLLGAILIAGSTFAKGRVN